MHMSLHLLRSEREDKHVLNTDDDVQRSWMHWFVIVFACVVGKKLKTPKFSLMPDDAIK